LVWTCKSFIPLPESGESWVAIWAAQISNKGIINKTGKYSSVNLNLMDHEIPPEEPIPSGTHLNRLPTSLKKGAKKAFHRLGILYTNSNTSLNIRFARQLFC
jgi:hypothetical protein